MGDVLWEIFWERTTLFLADDGGLSLPPLASAIAGTNDHVLDMGQRREEVRKVRRLKN
jgi:hypothetical protein